MAGRLPPPWNPRTDRNPLGHVDFASRQYSFACRFLAGPINFEMAWAQHIREEQANADSRRAFAQRPSGGGNNNNNGGSGNNNGGGAGSSSNQQQQQPRNNQPSQNQNQQPRGNTASSTATGYGNSSVTSLSAAGAVPPSPGLAASMSSNHQARSNNTGQGQASQAQAQETIHEQAVREGKVPVFFKEPQSGFIVKGNFMTLAAKPHLVEEGEWLAHLVVEQDRLLSGCIKCIKGAQDRSTGLEVCSEVSCPTMSAGTTTWTWIDTNRQPINIPAQQYIKHIQTWITGKITDQSLFPTDTFTSAPPLPNPAQIAQDPNTWLGKTSGFPSRFETEIRNMYKQMFRCYAHLYFEHWLFFWHTNSYKELNTCFVHFVNVGRLYGLLGPGDWEPMGPLIETWVRQGVLPEAKKIDGAAQMEKVTNSMGGNAGSTGGKSVLQMGIGVPKEARGRAVGSFAQMAPADDLEGTGGMPGVSGGTASGGA
ncbi:hypothetical protein LTR56_021495 [Elasticomyces elasticus]|nr:hypothetical protein LTR56_021495 [Elasticomyces elasticus]KAK3660502.1 hypothetical protein LTR22_007943 [Elasticomyces elasticus]KAK4923885.1 hypothetical protein LTR49_009033 [Elasticomyces elasticus]KAK5754839.1 hypothetical protein LTS12_015055 [Elasticomyces elasticus]